MNIFFRHGELHVKNQFLRGATIFYILLPSFFFLYGWLTLPFAIISTLALISFLFDVLLDAYRALPCWKILFKARLKLITSSGLIPGMVLVFFLIVFWLAFSGAGGVGFQNADYTANNALLKDLIVQDWPLTFSLNNAQVPMVYYVAYYLPAAIIGKAFGWVFANIFLFVWTLMGVMLAFVWFWKLSRVSVKNRVGILVLLTVIFCLAGGLDYIGYYVLKENTFVLNRHIEIWAGYFQYSSNTTLIYWVPQHTIASWLITGIIIDSFYDKHNLKHLGMTVAAGILWTPFGLIGTTPFLLALLFVYLQPQNRWYLFNWKSILFNVLSIGLGSLYLLYLGSNQFKFPIGFIWQVSKNYVSLVRSLLAFGFLEFAFLGFFVLLLILMGVLFSHASRFNHSWHKRIAALEREFGITPIQFCLFIICLCVLILLPFFNIGFNNDLVMRASIPSLFIFWGFVAKVVANMSFRVRNKFDSLYVIIMMIIIIGFFPSIAEITRSVKRYQLGPPPFGDVLTTLNADKIEYNLPRIGREDAIFFRFIGK